VCLVFEVVPKWGNNENTTKNFNLREVRTCNELPLAVQSPTQRERGLGILLINFFPFYFVWNCVWIWGCVVGEP